MPTARGALNANFINETLYAVGGSSDKPLPTNEAYDPSANAWTHKVPKPTSRHHAASSVIDGKLYVIGGRISSGSLDNIDVDEMYDPIQDIWVSNNLESMLSKRSEIAAASINNSIYVFGEEPSETFIITMKSMMLKVIGGQLTTYANSMSWLGSCSYRR